MKEIIRFQLLMLEKLTGQTHNMVVYHGLRLVLEIQLTIDLELKKIPKLTLQELIGMQQ